MGTEHKPVGEFQQFKGQSADRNLRESPASLAAVADFRIRDALVLIGTELAGGVSATAIASRVGLSRSRFEHLFRSETGTTFRNYRRQIRLSTALQLLANSSLSVKEISAEWGYAHTSNLTREFKREFGLTPSGYRRSAPRQRIAH